MKSIDWDEKIKRWQISSNRNDDIKARFVIMALGTASRAKLPGIPGIEELRATAFTPAGGTTTTLAAMRMAE